MNILTFDIEEWFHILDNDSTKTEKEWSRYETRIHANMDRLFSLLNSTNQKATFFCLGWVAEKHPEIIKKIDDLGFEIGTHSHRHQLVYEQKPKSFKKDLKKSIDLIEQITGKKVTSYRSPGFSLTEDCIWVFEILHELGIKIDCSVFPAYRSHGGFRNLKVTGPFRVKTNGVEIKEFPMSFWKAASLRLMFSGGGYFRLLPYPLIAYLTKNHEYVMTYFHPRDFDPGQPVIPGLSPIRRFKSYYGLSQSESKLAKYLLDFKFMDINKAEDLTYWPGTPLISF